MGDRELNPKLKVILQPAFPICAGAAEGNGCHKKVTIDATKGHLPRGFFGATGEIEDVELVLVVAEPGDPSEGDSTEDLLETYNITTDVFDPKVLDSRTGKPTGGEFHEKVRYILDECFPNQLFEDQLRKVWFTESVLCSAEETTKYIKMSVVDECGHRYLRAQLELFPNAVIGALGGKAFERIQRLKLKERVIINAWAAAPPGCKRPPAKISWQPIIDAVHKKRQQAHI